MKGVPPTRREVLAGGLALSMTLGRIPQARAEALQKVTVALGGDGLQISALHIANLGGFFREEGLEIELVDVNSGPRQTAALMGGSALFAPLGMIHAMKIAQAGGSLLAAAAMTNIMDIYIIVSNDAIAKTGVAKSQSIDERVRRLKGLKIGITSPGSTTDTNVRAMFKARGIDPDQAVKLVPLGGGTNMLASFEQGAVDAFAWSAPQPQVAVEKKLGQIIIDPFDQDIPELQNVPYEVMAINGATAKENEKVLNAAIRGLTKGYKFAHANPDKALQLVQARFPEFDKDVLAKVWPQYMKGLPLNPVVTRAKFDATQKWLNVTAETPNTVKFEACVTTDFAEKAAKDILGA